MSILSYAVKTTSSTKARWRGDRDIYYPVIRILGVSSLLRVLGFRFKKARSTMKNKVRFVVAIALLAGMIDVLRTQSEPGFAPLFNGNDLSGWEGNPKFWSVRDGAITGQTTVENPTQGNTFLIWKEGTLEDFELRLSYRIVGGNSGIQYRSKHLGNWVVGGYQADIEAGKTYSGILYEEKGRGVLAKRGEKTVVDAAGKVRVTGAVGDPAALQAAIKPEDWNDYAIVAQGNHLVHKINGRVTADVTDEQPDKRAMSGILALQLHAGPPMTVQFKEIRLKRLKSEKTRTDCAGRRHSQPRSSGARVQRRGHAAEEVPGWGARRSGQRLSQRLAP